MKSNKAFFEEYMGEKIHQTPVQVYDKIRPYLLNNAKLLNIGYIHPETLKDYVLSKGVDKVYTIELLDDLVNKGLNDAIDLGLDNKLFYTKGDVRNLSYSDNSFDQSICCSVLNFLGEDIPLALNELKRVTEKSLFLTFDRIDAFNPVVDEDSLFESEQINSGNGVNSYLYSKKGVNKLLEKYFPSNEFSVENSFFLFTCQGGFHKESNLRPKYVARIRLD